MLPDGEDPDTYVQKHGPKNFEKLLASSRRLSQVMWETLAKQHPLSLPEGRAALDDACKQTAGKIADATVKAHYFSYSKNNYGRSRERRRLRPKRVRRISSAWRARIIRRRWRR